jgi:hypothetical protein
MDVSDEERLKREKYVLDQEGGIMPMYEAFYIQAIIYSAGRAKDAFNRFDNAVRGSSDAASIVATAHEASTHVAALSRFFWPGRDKELYKARAAKLRTAFELSEASPLYDRGLRNALEHFDERLDEFLLQDLAGHFFPDPVVGSVSLIGNSITFMFRLVDPVEDIFVLLGEKHTFGELRKAVTDVLEKAQKMNEKGGRL